VISMRDGRVQEDSRNDPPVDARAAKEALPGAADHGDDDAPAAAGAAE
jgi:hypothetical protein